MGDILWTESGIQAEVIGVSLPKVSGLVNGTLL